MYLGDESSSSAVGKKTFFNKFLGSVYSGKQCYQPFDTANIIVLSDIIFITGQIKSQLRQNSLEMASKGIPSFVLHQSCDAIALLVYQLFTWICEQKIWPDVWKKSYVTLTHKSGSTRDITIYRPICILSKL